MSAIEIILTILLNILPVIIMFLPLLFLWNRAIGKLYLRIVVGISIFYFIYWILPVIFQFNNPINELDVSSEQGGLSLGYMAIHFFSLISIFISYPLVILPFIFIIAPLISFVMIWNRIRKEEGTTEEILNQTTYEFEKSPLQNIKEELINKDWTREKEIFKLMVVLLPVSLYILQAILKVSNLQNFSLSTSETALGWFLEILFVYLAIFIFSIELLYSSKVAIRGRYFGERVREQTFRSLYMVGTPISIISIFLFLLEYLGSIDIIVYFFAYFLMATGIFILFLDIFEQISIFILIKIVDWWKNKKRKIQESKKTGIYYGLVFGVIATVVYFLITLIFNFIIIEIFGDPQTVLNTGLFNADPTLLDAYLFDLLILIDTIILAIVPIIITTIFLIYTFRFSRDILTSIFGFMSAVILLSILFRIIGFNPLINFAPDEYWLTGRVSFTSLFGIDFFTLRTAAFEANLSGVLGILAIPYTYSRYVFSIILWGCFAYYLLKKFKISNVPIDEKYVKKVIFTNVDSFITYGEYREKNSDYFISKTRIEAQQTPEESREEVQNLLAKLEKDKTLKALTPQQEEEIKRFYFVLKYLYNQGRIEVWKPEFSYRFERVKKQALYIIYEDGRGVYDHEFSEEAAQDPGLISGMFSAITSFIKETTKSTEALKTIDHGDITILIEYGKKLFGALFIKGNQSSEVRTQLQHFVNMFQEKYSETLEDWSGALAPFADAETLVDKSFETEY
ncbi:MAG: hypothetical protein GF311_25195 [Candidatus Lokiarchaeota archaeon]|nr:hypothetical protein [Candidatus Lokiarchaeota archaeon]